MSEVEIQAQVKEMIRQKFMNRSAKEIPIDRSQLPEYKEALTNGDVKQMIDIKLGINEARAREERRETEYAGLDIVATKTELKGIDAQIEGKKSTNISKATLYRYIKSAQ